MPSVKLIRLPSTDAAISWCQATIAEQSVEELVEALKHKQPSPASGEGCRGGSARSAVFVTRRRSSRCLQLPGVGRFRTNLRQRQPSGMLDIGPRSTWRMRISGGGVSILKTSPGWKLNRRSCFRRDSIWRNTGSARRTVLLLGQR